MSNKWEVKTNKCLEAEDCSHAEDYPKPEIELDERIWAAIQKLCKDIKTEWQMLLCGTVDETGYRITGYYIPKQQVTSASVKNLDMIDKAFIAEHNVIATIHSHSDMGVFFSSTDKEDTNSSEIRAHICVNNKLQTCAVVRADLPCGRFMFKDAEVLVKNQYTEDEVEGVERIEKITYALGTTWGSKPTFKPKNDAEYFANLRTQKYEHPYRGEEEDYYELYGLDKK